VPHIVTNFRMSPSVRHYYNVTYGVGRNRRNEPLDVLLVQFLLNLLGSQSGSRFVNTPLVMDGLFGPLTETVIGAFQASWNRGPGRRRPQLDEDSVVSPAQGATRPVATRTWTILALNALAGHESGVGIDMYCRLHTHPDCPPRLHSFFASAPGRVMLRAVPSLPAPATGGAAAASPHRTLQELVERSRVRSRPSQGAPRRYNMTDPGVQWAGRVMNPGRAMFNAYEWSEIMEVMQGTGDWETHERWEILQQTIDLTLGETFLCGFPQLTIEEGQELLRQQAALGRLPSAR
jgi:hypothetical protein